MPDTRLFKTQNELVDFITDYLIRHDNTIVIIKSELRKDIVKSILDKENINNLYDTADSNENVLFIIKTGDRDSKDLSIKICNAYNTNTRIFKMIDINNILVVDGLISIDEMKSIIYYKELIKMELNETAA